MDWSAGDACRAPRAVDEPTRSNNDHCSVGLGRLRAVTRMISMRRMTRRVIGLAVGLVLGWSAAGYISQGLAGDMDLTSKSTAAAHGEVHDGHGDVAAKAAGVLMPATAAAWLLGVCTGAAVLFVLAVLLGIPALALKAPEPPDPAAHDHH